MKLKTVKIFVRELEAGERVEVVGPEPTIALEIKGEEERPETEVR